MTGLPGLIAAAVSVAGLAQALAGWMAVRRFCAQTLEAPPQLPGITVLKPLYGDEPLLEAALSSTCRQDYPRYQVLFGVQNPSDPARAVAERVCRQAPDCDAGVVVDNTADGANRKVANLINLLPYAKYDTLVIADSDIHAAPDYLRSIAATLDQPGTGLATTLYTGLPASPGIIGALGATAITHGFLPGALLARALGRQDCLGATMALRRETLARAGGLEALLPHLADDNVLGRLVAGLGLNVRLAATVPATTVPETGFAALWRHELRWARTIRAAEPLAFAASLVQYPLVWGLLAAVLSGGAVWALALLGLVWAARAGIAIAIGRALRPRRSGPEVPVPVWWLPLRDIMSVAVVLASYTGRRVEWRGHTMHARPRGPAPASTFAAATPPGA